MSFIQILIFLQLFLDFSSKSTFDAGSPSLCWAWAWPPECSVTRGKRHLCNAFHGGGLCVHPAETKLALSTSCADIVWELVQAGNLLPATLSVQLASVNFAPGLAHGWHDKQDNTLGNDLSRMERQRKHSEKMALNQTKRPRWCIISQFTPGCAFSEADIATPPTSVCANKNSTHSGTQHIPVPRMWDSSLTQMTATRQP